MPCVECGCDMGGDCAERIVELEQYDAECVLACRRLTDFVGYGVGCLEVAEGVRVLVLEIEVLKDSVRDKCRDEQEMRQEIAMLHSEIVDLEARARCAEAERDGMMYPDPQGG